MEQPTTDLVRRGRRLSANRIAVDVDTHELLPWVEHLLADDYRLALVAAHHDVGDTAATTAMRVVHLFTAGPPDSRIELHLRLDADAPALPTLAELSFPAGRFEREMRDLYGIVPRHHPLPRRLVRHPHWPRGWYPMHADAAPVPPFGTPEGPFPFLAVEGDGVYEIPVGPIHAGIIGPGHFRFSVVGETILKLKARLWYTHKGVEKLFEHRSPDRGLPLAERISGDTTVGHALAYCLAVEEATGITVAAHSTRERALLLELERLHNHIADLGALCNDVGHSILNAHAQRIRERLLRLNARVTGHRLLRGGVVLGGTVLRSPPTLGELAEIGDDTRELVALALGHGTVRDRLTGTATLTERAARDLGTLGYVARASGLRIDARLSHPFIDHRDTLTVPVHTTGDVLARFLVRAEEIDASLTLIDHLARDLPGGTAISRPPVRRRPGATSGVGIVEGWRGTIVHRVELAPDTTLTRVKIVDPSFLNWPALPVALADTIVPDFPLANKSFNLSYAGNDL
ncbi:NADH-quinone oxidoreductase subunit C [Embleya sp. AB8]|uniref:hydrogenase large subunit n=1 Tax=Embleya sp. AB8 TaxID=3156304 RepID=UPI003C754EA1